VFATFAQKSAKVRELENQRKAALAEIEMTNKLLAETKRTAQNSLNRLNLISQQILQRRKVISLLNQEVAVIDHEITDIRAELSKLEGELGVKRTNYGKSVQNIQKRLRSQDKLLFILSADNFSQSIRRMRYLREYADWQKRQAGEIIGKQRIIMAKREELEKSRIEKQQLLIIRESESRKLETEEIGQKKEVDELNKKQKQLQADLKKKQRQADALNRQIEKQIAEEVARANEEARAAREQKTGGKEDAKVSKERIPESKGGYAMTKEEKKLSDDFVKNRGRLPFPVSGQYSIVRPYGEQQHPDLKYVRTNNNGIDILTIAGAEVRAVFNGEVTNIFKLDDNSDNSIMFIRHGNYLTIYANLSEVYVKKGDKVNTRQALGKVYSDDEDENANILHFELRKEKVKQNPSIWLSH
jgi:septal ring factor EnvC (AmiA/AmiB activator)